MRVSGRQCGPVESRASRAFRLLLVGGAVAALIGGVCLLAAALSKSDARQGLGDKAASDDAVSPDRAIDEQQWLAAHLGKPAPDVELSRLALCDPRHADASEPRVGEKLRISSLRGTKIVCLFLSSFSWAYFRSSADEVERLYVSYKDHPEVAVYLVYEQECYPRSPLPGLAEGIAAHASLERRAEAAATCLAGLQMTLPVLLDTMDDSAAAAYNCRRSATVVIDRAGRVSFHESGAYGIQPRKAAEVIEGLLRAR